MRFLFLLLLISFSILGFAGKNNFVKVNMDEIRNEVSNPDSEFYYPKLIKRLNASDTTLGVMDYRHLYYGFVFQDNYTGLNNVRKKEIYELIENKKLKRAMDVCDSVLMDVPVSLSMNFIKLFLAQKMNENSFETIVFKKRYLGILLTILTSGDGKTSKTGYKTILISDDYDIAYLYYQLEEIKSQEFIGLSNQLTVKPNKAWKKKKLYFDASEYIKKVAENNIDSETED